jgi:predicted Zn finger-like uncharacterized protein
MNISCISCPARYGVPDAKLAGKRVRITCKRCGTALLVDATVDPPRISSAANAGPSVAPVARASLAPASNRAPAPKPAVEFMVVMPDDRQESADVAQIVRLYRDRQINAETLVWREGMNDWRAVWEVEEIAAAFRRMGYARPSQPTARPSQPAQASYEDADDASTHVVPSSQPPASNEFDDDEATSIVDSSRIPFDAPLPDYARSEDEDPTGVVASPMDLALLAPAAEPLLLRNERSPRRAATHTRRAAEADPAPSPPPAAVQLEPRTRAQTRGDARARAQGLDIFAEQAQRAAEQELPPAVEDDGARLTGARGENSVLFSLDQLVKQEQQSQRPVVLPARARTDESVLVDSSPSLPSGVVGSALAAPDFTAPVSAPPPRLAEAMGDDFEYPGRKKSGWLWPVVTIVLLGALAGGWFSGKLQPLLAAVGVPVKVPAPASMEASASAPAPSSASEAASAAPETSAAPEASASATPAPSAAPSAAPIAAASPRPAKPRESSAAAEPAADAPAAKESAPKPAAGGADFDTAAAKTALTAAANNASSCKEPGGPTGNGKVSITFAPSGRPTSVAVTGDLAGTTVGSCVARLFRSARVPAFSGDPVSVSKAFSVQ